MSGPPSPWTPAQTPSPATSTSTLDSDRRRHVPSTRAEVILARAKNSGSVVASSNSVLAKARRLGIKNLWSLEKTLVWLTKFKAKAQAQARELSLRGSRTEPRVEKNVLQHPAIKLESEANLTRPYTLELKTWPLLRVDGRPGSSPYSIPSSSKHKQKLAKRLDVDRDENRATVKVIPRKEEKQSPPAQKKKTNGFCEICNSNYSDLEKHLATAEHQLFVSDTSNWAEVDQLCIDNFSPSLLN